MQAKELWLAPELQAQDSMRSLYQDVRFGLRVLRGAPGFALVAVATLALGIAASTTVFTWIDRMLLDPLPGVSDGRRLVSFETVRPNGEFSNTSYRDHIDYRDTLKLVSGLAVWDQSVFGIGDADNPQRVWGELVSGTYFEVFGVQPAVGRLITREESGDTQGSHPVVVISHRLWRDRFQNDPRVVGTTLRVNRRELTIIGVTSPEFGGGTTGLFFDLWVPLTMAKELQVTDEFQMTSRTWRGLFSIARLGPGVSLAQARAEVEAAARRLAEANPKTNQGIGATLLPYVEAPHGAHSLLRRPLQILMAVCAVVLLIVCANVANLLLARAVSRQKEFGIRLAMGSGHARLTRQLLTETLLLAGAGALIAIPLAAWMSDALYWLLPASELPVSFARIALNGRILGFTMAACVLSALVAGIAPAVFSVRPNLNETLKEGGRGGGSGAHSHRLRGLLVISEIALATVALAGAGIFVRSFENARGIRPGFEPARVLLAQFYLPGYTPEQSRQFCQRLRERLGGAPGLTAVTYADTAPLGFGGDAGHDIEVDGYERGPNEKMNFSRTLTAPGYFDLMGIPLLEGRDFTTADDSSAPPVMIVNQTFTRRFFQGSSPLGRKVRVSGNRIFTVVGLAKDIKYRNLSEGGQPYFYMPFEQRYQQGRNIFFYLRGDGDPNGLAATLRSAAAAIDPSASFTTVPLAEFITASLYPQKVAARLLGALGLIALLLAAAGLYSVMSYAVSQRVHEFGVRMAMGAQRADILRLVMRNGLALALTGLAAGVVVALAFLRFVGSMRVNVSSADPVTFASVALFLCVVALLACYFPARRATQVNPLVALRGE